jgi:tetratricopeptide (TPR) repeat protein
MRGGIKALLVGVAFAAAGCTSEGGEINVRPLADPGSKLRPGIGEARAQLALGNVGLALEAFRKVLREQPDSAEAYAGIAACYDAMGRFDIARHNYEAALALAPKDPALLGALAVSLDKQGKRREAASVREEIAGLASAAAALDDGQPDPQAQVANMPPGPSITVPLPPARPAAAPTVAIPPPVLADAVVDVAPGPRLERLSSGEVALITMDEPAFKPTIVARTAQSTTVRWVPLREAAAPTRVNVRLLNAARREGIAARTRDYLLARGWRRIEIGDAPDVRASSVVLYPAHRRTIGRSVAAQFGFRSAVDSQSGEVVVLLGRDAPLLRSASTGG